MGLDTEIIPSDTTGLNDSFFHYLIMGKNLLHTQLPFVVISEPVTTTVT